MQDVCSQEYGNYSSPIFVRAQGLERAELWGPTSYTTAGPWEG